MPSTNCNLSFIFYYLNFNVIKIRNLPTLKIIIAQVDSLRFTIVITSSNILFKIYPFQLPSCIHLGLKTFSQSLLYLFLSHHSIFMFTEVSCLPFLFHQHNFAVLKLYFLFPCLELYFLSTAVMSFPHSFSPELSLPSLFKFFYFHTIFFFIFSVYTGWHPRKW